VIRCLRPGTGTVRSFQKWDRGTGIEFQEFWLSKFGCGILINNGVPHFSCTMYEPVLVGQKLGLGI
jgi:hypothetical protein